MLIIGLCGKFGSGKDFIGRQIQQYLQKEYPGVIVQTLGFADPLKMHVLAIHPSIRFDEVYPLTGDKPEYARMLLQQEGDLMRRRNPHYWIDQYTYWSHWFERKGCDVLITCDVRFRDEMDHIVHDRGGIVCKVHAPSRTYTPHNPKLAGHVSERDLDIIPDNQYFYVFENDAEYDEERFRVFFDRLKRVLN